MSKSNHFKVEVKAYLDRPSPDGQERRYHAVATGHFFRGPVDESNPLGLYLDRWSVEPSFPFNPSFEEKGLILRSLYEEAKTWIRQNS